MNASLESFPKYVGKYMPDHKLGVNTSIQELAEIGREAIAWRSTFEKELKEMLDDVQTRENGCNCYSCEQKIGAYRVLTEILGPQLTRILTEPTKENKPLWVENKVCPVCGSEANPDIKAAETGCNYCSMDCAKKDVKAKEPAGGY